jgi:hypothetical protein
VSRDADGAYGAAIHPIEGQYWTPVGSSSARELSDICWVETSYRFVGDGQLPFGDGCTCGNLSAAPLPRPQSPRGNLSHKLVAGQAVLFPVSSAVNAVQANKMSMITEQILRNSSAAATIEAQVLRIW